MFLRQDTWFKMGPISLKHYLRFISFSVLLTRQRCKCEQAAKAGCGSAGHWEPAYSAHQSCRKSPKLLPEAEPVPTAQINSCLASFHGHSFSVSTSSSASRPPSLQAAQVAGTRFGFNVCLFGFWVVVVFCFFLVEAPHHDSRLLAVSSPNPCAALAV